MLDWIGWLATGVFAASYFTKTPQSLRGVQALAACLWIVYGISVHAAPVIAANVAVAAIAAFSAHRQRRRARI